MQQIYTDSDILLSTFLFIVFEGINSARVYDTIKGKNNKTGLFWSSLAITTLYASIKRFSQESKSQSDTNSILYGVHRRTDKEGIWW